MSFEIRVNGRKFDLWETATVQRSIDMNSGLFRFTSSNTVPADYPVRAGDEVQILINGVSRIKASILKNRVESFLDTQKDVGGLIVDYSPDDVQVIITGNTARINMAVQPAQGLDYINVTVTYEDNELTA